MNYQNRINIEPKIRGGKPRIRNLRITVYDILELLAAGSNAAEILEDFPELEPEDIQAVLSFAADRERHIGEILASA